MRTTARTGDASAPMMWSGKPISVTRSLVIDQRHAVLGDAIQILQIRHGDDAVFAQCAGIMKHARCAGFVITMIEVVTDDHDALADAPLGGADGQVRGCFHPFVRAAVIRVVVIGAQKEAVSRPDARAYGPLQIVLGDRLAECFEERLRT